MFTTCFVFLTHLRLVLFLIFEFFFHFCRFVVFSYEKDDNFPKIIDTDAAWILTCLTNLIGNVNENNEIFFLFFVVCTPPFLLRSSGSPSYFFFFIFFPLVFLGKKTWT